MRIINAVELENERRERGGGGVEREIRWLQTFYI